MVYFLMFAITVEAKMRKGFNSTNLYYKNKYS